MSTRLYILRHAIAEERDAARRIDYRQKEAA